MKTELSEGTIRMQLSQGTWVIVADGEKFLLLENIGDEAFLHLKVAPHQTQKNPPARDLQSDRPGRQNDASRQTMHGVQAWGKSSMTQTDWHQVAEDRFAAYVAKKLSEWVGSGRIGRLVVIADPHTLGTLRQAYDDPVRAAVIAEIDKDITNLPLDKIEASITAHAIK